MPTMPKTYPGCCRRLGVFVVVGALLLLSNPARGASVVAASVAEFARSADLVVRAVVVGRETRAEAAEGHQRVVTFVTLSVAEVVVGDVTAPEVVVRVPGGTLGPWRVHTPGAPDFAVGEEVVVFLEATPQGFQTMGLRLGKFTVFALPLVDAFLGDRVAVRDLSDLVLFRRTAAGRLEALPLPGPETSAGAVCPVHAENALLLADLVDRVRAARTRP